jgi:hypothetical protein
MNKLDTENNNDNDIKTNNDNDSDNYYCDDYDGDDLKIKEDNDYDIENLVTCGNCCNVWDGYAQCNCHQIPCYYSEEESNEDIVEDNVKNIVKDNQTETISSKYILSETINIEIIENKL